MEKEKCCITCQYWYRRFRGSRMGYCSRLNESLMKENDYCSRHKLKEREIKDERNFRNDELQYELEGDYPKSAL